MGFRVKFPGSTFYTGIGLEFGPREHYAVLGCIGTGSIGYESVFRAQGSAID